MKRRIIVASMTAMMAVALWGEGVSPLWLRNSEISPDGKNVAFTYKGDVYVVATEGGAARQLTTSPAYDTEPKWSPDGKRIAFASDRRGSMDIYVVDAAGGTPRRVTTHSGGETPLTWLDNGRLLFNAMLMPAAGAAQGPFQAQTYVVDVDGENVRPQAYVTVPMNAATVMADGTLLYQDRKSVENVWRKHERSSGTADIWHYDPSTGKYRKLTVFGGHDLNPVAGKGDTYYYVSEQDGTLNVWRGKLGGTAEQLTRFKNHPVRSLSASADGTLAFSWNGELYSMTPGGEPKKIAVSITTDDYDADEVKNYRRNGATQIAVSPGGEEVAFVVRGDVYVTSTKYNTTRRITDTPAQERRVSFSPDGRTLVYDSDRDGRWQLFTATIADKDEKLFTYATEIKEEPLYSCATSAQQPVFSPDGKKVAFLENRTELRVIDVKSKKVNTALAGRYNYSYTDGDVGFEWSPDSRRLLVDYIGEGGWNNSDIAMVSADGSEVVDLTESGYSDGNAKWVLGGKGVAYMSGRFGMRSHGSWGNQNDVLLMVLDGDAWDEFNFTEEEAALKEKAAKSGKKKKEEADSGKTEKVKPIELELEGRRYRMARLTPGSASIGDYYLSPKGDVLYYTAAATEGGMNLLKRDLRKGDTKVLVKGVRGGLVPDAKGENLYVLSSGIQKINLAKGSKENVDFEAPYSRTPSKEREYMYDHMWKQVKDKFYDANLHGVDWEMYGENYRRFLPHVNNNYDFAIVLSEVLGELNASHTGGRYRSMTGAPATATLGAYWDETFTGDGLRVAELLPMSPLGRKSAGVEPGDVITHIDGEAVKAGADYYPLLEGKSGKKVRLTVKKKGGKEKSVEVKALSPAMENQLLYARWVARNEAIVDSLSGGRIGYVHVKGMDSPSFRNVYDRLLGKYRNCDAVVVDTRHNGGGWLHNDLAQLLGGKEYVRFTPRGRYIGSEPFSQWTKPSAMLVDETNYSDAHGSPFVYQTLGLGKIVGAPVPGTMTAVWWESQIDPTIVFGIPQVTSQDMDGHVLENRQLNPDILIYNAPEDVVAGKDSQLEGAVRHLLEVTGGAK